MRYDVIVKGGERTEVPAGLLRSTLRYMRKKKARTIAEMIFELSARLDDYPD